MTENARSGDVEQVEAEAEAALRRGDRRATLTVLMNGYGAAIYRYCRRMTSDDDLAQDVHQTVFVQAYQGLKRFRGQSTMRSWLYGIARHRCLDAIKLGRRRNRRFVLTDEPPEESDVRPEALDPLERAEISALLKRCLERLKPRTKSAILLRFVEGFTYVEMSAVTGSRPAALQASVVRAMPMLRRCLETEGLAR